MTVCGRTRPDAVDASASFSYFARPQMDADAAGQTLARPSKVAFSLQP